VAFTWTINDWTVSALGNRSSAKDSNVNLNAPIVTGGRAPVTWSATNLPLGLSINAHNGKVMGKPTTKATYAAKVTATDGRGESRSTSFTWTIT
jgi:hypothetical protein